MSEQSALKALRDGATDWADYIATKIANTELVSTADRAAMRAILRAENVLENLALTAAPTHEECDHSLEWHNEHGCKLCSCTVTVAAPADLASHPLVESAYKAAMVPADEQPEMTLEELSVLKPADSQQA